MFDHIDGKAVSAFDRLIRVYFGSKPETEVLTIDPAGLEQQLVREGISPLALMDLVRQLELDRVLAVLSSTIPAGTTPRGIIGGIPVWDYRSEPEIDNWFETTRLAWLDWLRGYRGSNPAGSASPTTSATGEAADAPEASADQPQIVSLGDRRYRLGSGQPKMVTARQDAVLQAFLVEGGVLDSKKLMEETNDPNAPRVLRSLAESFGDAIVLPGVKSAGGYRVRIAALDSADDAD